MSHKLNYFTVQYTSEDDTAKAKDLLHQAPGVKGWMTAKFPIYPQEMILQLDQRSHVTKIQLLVHQSLIPEKIEIYIGDTPPGRELSLINAQFAHLGYVNLSENDHTQHKARELKSIIVDCTGVYLKLVLHKNYNSRLNRFNQISIVGLNIFGNEEENNNNNNNEDQNEGEPLWEDLGFTMYVDTDIATTIQQLEGNSIAALKGQRFNYTQKLKDVINKLRIAGESLGKIEIEKKEAIDNEQFDKAKHKKQIQDEYREEVYEGLMIEELLERDGVNRRNDQPSQSFPTLPILVGPKGKTSPKSTSSLPPARPANTPPRPPPSPPRSPSPPPLRTPARPLPNLRGSGIYSGEQTPLPRAPPPATYNIP